MRHLSSPSATIGTFFWKTITPRAWQKQPTAKKKTVWNNKPPRQPSAIHLFNDALALRIFCGKKRGWTQRNPLWGSKPHPKQDCQQLSFKVATVATHPIATKTPTRFCCDESEVFQDLTISTVSSGCLARTESGSQPTEKSTFGLFFQLLLLFEVTTWTVLQNKWEGRGDKTSLFFLRCKSSTSNNLNCQAGH